MFLYLPGTIFILKVLPVMRHDYGLGQEHGAVDSKTEGV
jgi:hypothetical protein